MSLTLRMVRWMLVVAITVYLCLVLVVGAMAEVAVASSSLGGAVASRDPVPRETSAEPPALAAALKAASKAAFAVSTGKPAARTGAGTGTARGEGAETKPNAEDEWWHANAARTVKLGAINGTTPTTEQALLTTISSSRFVRAVGARRAASTAAVGEGATLVGMGRMAAVVDLDEMGGAGGEHARSVTVQAGMVYRKLAERLRRNGWALTSTPADGSATIGGAVAVAETGALHAVASARIVRANGESHVVASPSWRGHGATTDDPSRNEAWNPFYGSVAALGASGVILEVTLSVEPTYEVMRCRKAASQPDQWSKLPLADSVARVVHERHGTRSLVALERVSSRGRESLWRLVHDTRTRLDLNASAACVDGAAPETLTWDADAWTRAGVTRGDEAAGGDDDASPPHVSSEYFVDVQACGATLDAVGKAVSSSANAAAVVRVELRRVAPDRHWLSPCRMSQSPEGCCATRLVYSAGAGPAAMNAVASTVEVAIARAGISARPGWGSLTMFAPAELVRAFGANHAHHFATLASEHDPEAKFRASRSLARVVYDATGTDRQSVDPTNFDGARESLSKQALLEQRRELALAARDRAVESSMQALRDAEAARQNTQIHDEL
ncbi:hypothetical protein PPROV_000773400 [Pycnococcus provasolii]|uniref:FAD-binding PCMH-type domain-containing protein n=1 Tax=Pycnococcus provasolii TaxID=41880 RepID=A0A830HVS1_9CHLO|nr:hypothetical protein PPROV_000773400 [Pycnococcus provasolii]